MYICWISNQDDENIPGITHESFASLVESNPKYHTNPELTNEQRFRLETLLESYDIFANGLINMEPTPMIEHSIPLTDENQAVYVRPYKTSAKESEIFEQKAKNLLMAGIIKPSISPFNNPVLLIKKPSGDYRLVVDLRRINKITRKQTYPIPRIDSAIDELSGKTWFTSIDCASGYWTISLKEEDQHKTAFSTAHGHWDWTRVVQGLIEAPYTFASLMNRLFIDIRGTKTSYFFDDIVILGKSFDEHLQNIDIVLGRIRNSKLRLQRHKCTFAERSIKFLGYRISEGNVQPDADKLRDITQIPKPSPIEQLQSFIGKCSYYRNFTKYFYKHAAPLYSMTKLRDITWTEDAEKDFEYFIG